MHKGFFCLSFLVVLCSTFAMPAMGAETRVPFIMLACKLDPNIPPTQLENGHFSGYDCVLAQAIRHGTALLDLSAPTEEVQFKLSKAMRPVGIAAEKACGKDCRFFYAVIGQQCMAVAQSRYVTGLGSFTTTATTQEQAEEMALTNCQNFPGGDGKCRLVVSECVKGVQP